MGHPLSLWKVTIMWYRIFADILVIVHFGFILYVIGGGLLSIRWRQNITLHVLAASWGVIIEFYSWVCPLTFLENKLRYAASTTGYETSFIEHYLWRLIYPDGLTTRHQIILGLMVLLINCCIYGWIYHHKKNWIH